MQRFKSSILVISLIVIGFAASLLTVLGLYFSGILKTELVELVYSVQSVTKVYDGTPLVSDEYELISGELIKGHTATVTAVGGQTDVGTGEGSLQVKVTDEKGFDVTDEYAVKVETGALIVSPAEIYVSLLDEEVVYNGKKVIFENYNVDRGKLVSGHKIGGSLPNIGLVNVGDYLPEDLVPVVFDAAGKDVSSNYRIAFDFDSAGAIRIIPRPITVAPVDVRKTYDGTELVAKDFEILSGSLAEDQWAEVEINGGDNSMTNAGGAVTEITGIAIYAQGGGYPVEVTGNYEIDSSETGTMLIDRRSLVVTAKSASWTYDGRQHSLSDDTNPETISGLAPTDSLVAVRYEATITEVDEVPNNIDELELTSSLDNYNVQYIPGKLIVTPFRATVALKSFTKEYDGVTANETFKDETIYNISPKLPDGFNLYIPKEEGLSEEAGASEEDGLPKKADAGSYTYTLKGLRVQDASGDCTKNFELTLFDGTVTITPRTVTVTTPSKSAEYGSKDYNAEKGLRSFDKPKLLNGLERHTAVIKDEEAAPGQIGAGSKPNEFECVIMDGENDVTQNYRIIYLYGTLTVTKKPVSIFLNNQIELTYNGKDQVKDIGIDNVFKDSGIGSYRLTKDDFVCELPKEVKNVGEYVIAATLKDVKAVNDKVVNYAVTVESGLVKVKPKALTITAPTNATKIYDGKPIALELSAFSLRPEGGTGADGVKLVSINIKDNNNVLRGSHTITTDQFYGAQLYNGVENVTGNYQITYSGNVSVQINQRLVMFSLSDYFYKGTDYPPRGGITQSDMAHCGGLLGSLAEGDKLEEITYSYNDTNHTIRITGFTIRNSKNQDVSNCYTEDRFPTAQVILVQE